MKKLFPIALIALLFSCKKGSESFPYGKSSDLVGTKWHIYQYKDETSSIPQSRNDTLTFIDAEKYKYNNQSHSYYLNKGDYTHLTLNSTPFGDISGTVPGTFIESGEIIAVPFSQVHASGSLKYYLWLKKI